MQRLLTPRGLRGGSANRLRACIGCGAPPAAASAVAGNQGENQRRENQDHDYDQIQGSDRSARPGDFARGSPPAAGGDSSSSDIDSAKRHRLSAMQSSDNPANGDVKLTIGSKNFTEQYILGEIYAQALSAAGYDVSTDLNLGSEQVALKALAERQHQRLPRVHLDGADLVLQQRAGGRARRCPAGVRADRRPTSTSSGLVAYPPTPFSSANAVGMLKSTADELGVSKISDLEGKSQDLTLFGSPECRQRIDCLVGLAEVLRARLQVKFTPGDIGLRYRGPRQGRRGSVDPVHDGRATVRLTGQVHDPRGRQGRAAGRQHPLHREPRRRPTRPAPTSATRSRRSSST